MLTYRASLAVVVLNHSQSGVRKLYLAVHHRLCHPKTARPLWARQSFFRRCSSSAADLDRRGQPIRSLVLAPLALLFDAVLGREPDADAVLLVVLPLADVLVAIGQDHSAVAVFLASSEVAFVHAPILIGQLALSFKQVLGEGAFVSALRFGKVVHAYSNKQRSHTNESLATIVSWLCIEDKPEASRQHK